MGTAADRTINRRQPPPPSIPITGAHTLNLSVSGPGMALKRRGKHRSCTRASADYIRVHAEIKIATMSTRSPILSV